MQMLDVTVHTERMIRAVARDGMDMLCQEKVTSS